MSKATAQGSLALVLAAALLCACGSSDEPAPGAEAGAGVTVKVALEGSEQEVPLSSLAAVVFDGEDYVRLSEVVSVAFPGEATAQLLADFEAADGFRPELKDFCKDLVPVDGTTLSQGYLQRQSRNVRWDESFSYPGCMSPTDLAIIALSRKPQ